MKSKTNKQDNYIRYFWQNAKNNKLILFAILLLLIINSTIIVSSPYFFARMIDNVIIDDEHHYAVYNDYRDGTGFNYNNQFYSLFSKYWQTPDEEVRIIKYKEDYYQLHPNYELEKDYSIRFVGDQYFLKTSHIYKPIKHLDDELSANLKKQRLISLKQLITIIIIMFILSLSLIYLLKLLFSKLSCQTMIHLSKDLYRALLHHPVDSREQELMTVKIKQSKNSLKKIKTIYSQLIQTTSSALTSTILALFALLLSNWQMVSLTFAPLLVISVFILIFKVNSRSLISDRSLRIQAAKEQLRANFQKMSLIQSFNLQDRFLADFDNYQAIDKKFQLKKIVISSLKLPLITFIFVLAATYFILQLSLSSATMGDIIAISSYYLIFYLSFLKFNRSYQQMKRLDHSTNAIFTELNAQSTGSKTKLDLETDKLEITFKKLSYQQGDYRLEDLSFEIKQGETIALMASETETKALAFLLNGTAKADSGKIIINQKNIDDYTKTSLNNQIAIISKTATTFSDNYAEQINFLLEEFKEEDEKLIKSLERDLLNPLYTKKSKARLLAIARVLLRNQGLIIIENDEQSTELEVINNYLAKLNPHASKIIATRNLNQLKSADKIVLIDNGRLLEYGNHTDLLNKKGAYYRFYKLQTNE